MGVLTLADQAVFAAYCISYSKWRHAEEGIVKSANKSNAGGLLAKSKSGTYKQNVLVAISNKAATDMVKFASEMGFSPTARARMAVRPPQGTKSKYAGLIKAVK